MIGYTMNDKDIEIRKKIIENTFQEKRKIEFVENEKYTEELFITQTGEIIYLDFQLEDFTEKELARYSEIAEELYEQYQKEVFIYIICPSNIEVCVRECEIKSEADFTIKLACITENPTHTLLKILKEKQKNNEKFTEEDLHILSMLPVMCEKEDRTYFREECFKIMNGI